MVFWSTLSTRSVLSPQQLLEFSNVCLENARKTKDAEVALQLCDSAEAALSQMKKAVKAFTPPGHSEDHQSLPKEIAAVYFELGKLEDSLGHSDKAQANYKKAEQWG